MGQPLARKKDARKFKAVLVGSIALLSALYLVLPHDDTSPPILNHDVVATIIRATAPSSHYEPSLFSSEEDLATLTVEQCPPIAKKCAQFTLQLSDYAYFTAQETGILAPGKEVIVSQVTQ